MDDQGEAAQMYQLNLVSTGDNGDNIYNLEAVENKMIGEEDMDKSVVYSCKICQKVCNSQRSLSLHINFHNAPDKVKTNDGDAVIKEGYLFTG